MNICKNCGQEFETGNFCPNCGTEVVLEQPEIVTPDVNVVEPVQEKNEIPMVDPGASLGNISFILGLVALISGTICSCVLACLGGALPFACAVTSIVLSIIALNKSKEAGFNNKKAITGLILSIVSLVVIIIFVVLNGFLGVVLSPFFEELMYELY